MNTNWSAYSPNMSKDLNEEICVTHNHCRTITYSSFSFLERGELKKIIAQQSAALKGCIAFFKTYAEDKNVPVIERATAASIVAEDEARLDEFQNHKPNCVIS